MFNQVRGVRLHYELPLPKIIVLFHYLNFLSCPTGAYPGETWDTSVSFSFRRQLHQSTCRTGLLTGGFDLSGDFLAGLVAGESHDFKLGAARFRKACAVGFNTRSGAGLAHGLPRPQWPLQADQAPTAAADGPGRFAPIVNRLLGSGPRQCPLDCGYFAPCGPPCHRRSRDLKLAGISHLEDLLCPDFRPCCVPAFLPLLSA